MQRTIREDVDEIVEILHRNGLDTYFVDLTRPETKVHCVKVIVPRLRHFWARYAPGRLYEVPVTLGWIPHSRDEDQLNPTPFFL